MMNNLQSSAFVAKTTQLLSSVAHLRLLLVMLLTLTASTAWSETVTYTVSSTSAVTTSGTTPDGSSVDYSSTYSTKCQLTKNNSMTLTLSGYDGCKISGLTLSMKSNSGGGAGNMSMKIGSTTVSSISTANFNHNSWNGAWSTTYVDITPAVTTTTVGNNETIVIKIAATANSLYCESFTLTYEAPSGGDDAGDTNCLTLSASSNYPFNSTSSSNTSVSSTTIDGITFENKGGYKYNSYLSFNKSLSGAYIANTTPFSGNIESIVVDYYSGGSDYFNMYEGSASKPSSTVVSPSKTGTGSVTYTFSGNNPYFKLALKTTGTYCNINSITICYSNTPTLSYTVTATSNNNDYGTVSVSGTTITASPKTGYTYANPAFTVTSGTATVTQNGNTFTVTPSSDCSIQINFAEKVKNTYIDNVQGNSEQALYDSHKTPTLTDQTPATTGTCEQQHWHFMGWVTEANKENPTDANIVKANTSVTANGTTYYAVWAKGTTTGGGSTSKQYSFDITPSNFNSTSYAANNNEKTSTAKASDGSTLSVKWISNQVMLQSSAMQWQKSAGYIYNSTDLGTINSVTVTKSAGTFTTYYGTSKQPSSSTTVGNGYFQIKVGSATGQTSKVTITFTKTTQGAQTTTYSDYITSCTTQTVPSLSASVSTLAFNEVTVNSPKELEFTLNGFDLTADATLALSGTNAGMFSVSPTPVTPSNGSITNQTITVTYTPTTKASHSATLTISSTDAENVTISLSGTGVAHMAYYTVKHYKQNLDDTYPTEPTETEYSSGEVGTEVTPAFKSYEGFTAPTEEKSVEITADGKAIVEYQYARNSYTLTWNLDGGTIKTAGTAEGLVKYGASLTAPVVEKDGFNFKGWDLEVPNTMPAANATYTAQWKKKHTIKWIVNGDTDTPYATTYVVDGDVLALPSSPNVPSTCEEKVFVGWTESATVNADGSDIEYVDENTKPNTDKNYYAVFASLDGDAAGDYKKVTSELSDWSGEYLIVYETSETAGVAFDGSLDALDDTSNDTKSVEIENESIAATEETNDINFTIGKIENSSNYYIKSASGKYIGRTTCSNGMNVSSSDKYPHQISFSDPGWSISVGEIIMLQSVINSSIVGTPMLLYSGTGSRFRYYDSAQEPIALYRKSSYTDYTTVCVETYNVKYDANGATSGNVPVDEKNYILNATVTVLGNTGNLQKTHFSFVGWNTQTDGNGTSYQAGETFTITEDVTLYAIWEEIPQYSVTWYVNGKQLTDIELSGASKTVYKGDRITKTPPAPNPEDFCGQVFVGWTDAEMDVNNTDKPTIYNLVDEFPTASGDQTFYAVFADYKEQ